jgi:iron complex outermembrane receptor protein
MTALVIEPPRHKEAQGGRMRGEQQHRGPVTLVALATLALPIAWAAAQDQAGAPAAGHILEELVVTVQRREQNLQDVTSMAQAFTAADLKLSGVGSELRNLPMVVPGLNIANQEGNVEIFIRGVGTANNTELGDPSAATHLNGVYLPRPRGLSAMLFDLERVEVNKGPQGTLRGRNAIAGTLNIISRKPQLGELDGYAEIGFGDYDAQSMEGALNVPVGERFAFRVAAFADSHDSYFRNAGLQQNLTPAGEEDEQSVRLSALWQPSEQLSVLLVGDYLTEGGTGYPGANMFATFDEVRDGSGQVTFPGFRFDQVDPRAVVYRGWQGVMDTEHWGAALTVTYDFGGVALEYLGSHRDLDFEQTNAESDNIAFPGRDLSAVDYDNWGNQFWLTRSESQVHELRAYSSGEGRAHWTAGVFYFDEDQEVGFFSSSDHGFCCFSGVEFTMPDVSGESLAAYADITFDVTDRLRLTAGLRQTEEEKSRFGIGGNYALIGGGEGFACCFSSRFSTPGFMPLFLDRPYFDATRGGRSPAELVNLILSGVQFGQRDTLDDQLAGVTDGSSPNGTCIDTPDLDNGFLDCPANGQFSFLGITAPEQQFGEYEDDFLDWRAGIDFDLTDASLLYLTVTTGHKSGGFNDTVTNPAFDPAEPESDANPRYLQALVFDPEELIAYELGSKNRLELANGPAILNGSVFYYDYKDQVFQVLNVIGGIGGTQTGSSQQSVNIADSDVLGIELEASFALPAGFRIGGNLLWLDTEIKEGVVSDVRATNFGNLAATPDADLEGNELPKAPEITAILRIQQEIGLAAGGAVDWQILANYASEYFLSIFNEQDVVEPTNPAADLNGDGVIGTASATQLGFDDVQDALVTLNVGVGYSSATGALRVEGFVSNLLDEDASTKALFQPSLNLRFLNDPRTMGVRLRYRF